MSVGNAKALLVKSTKDMELLEKIKAADPEGFDVIAEAVGHPCNCY